MSSTRCEVAVATHWRSVRALVAALLIVIVLTWNPVATGAVSLEWAQKDVDELRGELITKELVPLTGVTFGIRTCQAIQVELQSKISRNAGDTPTFAVFVQGSAPVPFPANNRVFIRFKDTGGATRGATSMAVRTQ